MRQGFRRRRGHAGDPLSMFSRRHIVEEQPLCVVRHIACALHVGDPSESLRRLIGSNLKGTPPGRALDGFNFRRLKALWAIRLDWGRAAESIEVNPDA